MKVKDYVKKESRGNSMNFSRNEEMFASYAKPIVNLNKFYRIPELFPMMSIDAIIDIHKKNIFGVIASPHGRLDGTKISKFLNMCVDAIGTSKLSIETVKGIISLLPLKDKKLGYEVYSIKYSVGEYGTYIELKDKEDDYILHLYDADTMDGRGNDKESLGIEDDWDKNLSLKRFCAQKQNHLMYLGYDRYTYKRLSEIK